MQHTPQRPLFSFRHRRAIILSLTVAAAGYLLALFLSGAGFDIFARIGWLAWLLLPASAFTSYLLRFIRWQYFLAQAGWKLPPFLHLAYYLAGFALTTTPAKAGETVRSLLLRPHGIPYPTSLACFFSERLLDVITVALIAIMSAYSLAQLPGFILVLCVLTAALVPLLHSPILIKSLDFAIKHVHARRLQSLLAHLQTSLQDARQFLAWKSLSLGLVLGLIAWCLQGLAFWYLLHDLGFDMPVVLALGVYAVSLLAGALSMIPGGIGATEASMALLLGSAGASSQIAIVAPVITRLGTLWFAVALGILASAWLAGRAQAPIQE